MQPILMPLSSWMTQTSAYWYQIITIRQAINCAGFLLSQFWHFSENCTAAKFYIIIGSKTHSPRLNLAVVMQRSTWSHLRTCNPWQRLKCSKFNIQNAIWSEPRVAEFSVWPGHFRNAKLTPYLQYLDVCASQ